MRVANGQNIAKGDGLASNGAGLLVKAVTQGHEILFWAEEAFNNNTGASQLISARPAQGRVP